MFFEKVDALCKKNGTTITAMVKSLGMSSSSGTNWKNGIVPGADTLKLVADHLKVSMDYLMSDTEDVHNRPLTDNEVALLALFEKLDERDQVRFIGRLEEFVEASNL